MLLSIEEHEHILFVWRSLEIKALDSWHVQNRNVSPFTVIIVANQKTMKKPSQRKPHRSDNLHAWNVIHPFCIVVSPPLWSNDCPRNRTKHYNYTCSIHSPSRSPQLSPERIPSISGQEYHYYMTRRTTVSSLPVVACLHHRHRLFTS